MKRILFLVLLSTVAGYCYGQKVSVAGVVKDAANNALPSATVMLLNPVDSSLVNFTVTNLDGSFQVKGLSSGSYLLQITFVGFETYRKSINAVSDVQLGTINMQTATRQLDELTIEGEKIPVTVKRDTIEFNAGSFRVKQNATVEDLLKKLPGIEVENDGNVKAQGEDVQRVMVDGREFFGRDPKLATRNLPADAVDKVQVFDKKSDQSVFTGIDDGQREKTINLELKEEKRKGAFGTLMAGLGTIDRFEAKASVNKFSKTSQLSFLGMGNNTNDQGFSLDDYMNFTGGSMQMMGGGGGAVRIELSESNNNGVPLNLGGNQNGITSNFAGGINFNRDVSKDTKAGGSYFYNHVDQDVNTTIDRINYLPAGNYLFNQKNRQKNLSDNQRLNFSIEHDIDSANSIKLTSYVSTSKNNVTNASESSTRDENGALQNESSRLTSSKGTGLNLNSDLLYRHRFPKKGRSLSANVNLGVSNNDSDGSVGSLNQFYSSTPETRNISQESDQANEALYLGATTSYTEPLGGRKYLEVNYNYRVNTNQVLRDVWDVSGGQQVFDPFLSSKYKSQYTYNRPGINFRLIRQKFNLMAGASYQNTRLFGDLIYQDVTIDKTFENLLPVVRFNYDFSNFKHLRIDYETSMQEPTIQELQPVINNSDPLNLSVGNPNLRPGYSHQIRTSFTYFDPATFINVFSFLTGNYTTDAISTSQMVDQNLVRTTQPVNVAGNYSLNGSIHFGFPIKKLKSRAGIRVNGDWQHGITLLNNTENAIDRLTTGATVTYSYNLDEKLNVDLRASVEDQKAVYDFEVPDQRFLNKTYEAEFTLKLLKHYQLNPQFRLLDYSSQTTDFQQTIPLLDISFSRFLLKNNVGELKVGVRNLLDKNLSVTQASSTNYLEQRTYNNLGRYFMISFTYALNKQLNPMNGRGGAGHMIRR